MAHWTITQRLHQVQRILDDQGCRTITLYLWRPHYETALDLIDHDLCCYHIDDEYTWSTIEKPLDAQEARLISRVDQVFIHSPALLDKKGHLNPRTTFVPNGVDYDAYATRWSEPPDLEIIPHLRIGYVGIIKKQPDFALLMALAQRHQQWSFVFVGPQGNLGKDAALVQKFSHMPNVYFLGGKPVSALGAIHQVRMGKSHHEGFFRWQVE